MTGTDCHLTGLAELPENIKLYADVWKNQPGYEGYLNDRVATLPEILAENGYNTLMSGKWHLGQEKDQIPAARGFQKSFSMLGGWANHYMFDPDGTFHPTPFTKDHEFVDFRSLKDFYSTDSFTTELIKQIDESDKSKPFFAYLPFMAPHWPLQAPKHLIEKYKGWYSEGPDVLRQKRLTRQKQLNLIDDETTVHEVVAVTPAPVKPLPTWNEMGPEEQAKSARSMEVFAAMVDSIDQNVGRVVEYLETNGQLDNTFIVFISDNGAAGAVLESAPFLSIQRESARYINNSLDNMGMHDSFVWYGPRWAQAATAPSRLSKGHVTEGGIRCPAIIRYPKLFREGGRVSNEFSTVMDILPTILDLAGVRPVGETFRGKRIELPRGVSWVNHFKFGSNIYGHNTMTGWTSLGQLAIRRGKFKAVFIPKPDNSNGWELFDLEADKGETHDLSEEQPDLLEELIKDWGRFSAETGVVELPEEYRYDSTQIMGRQYRTK
jgi:arylsulfatase